jgi:hypothetical protein
VRGLFNTGLIGLNILRTNNFQRRQIIADDIFGAIALPNSPAAGRCPGVDHNGGVSQSDHLHPAKRYCLGLA